MTDTGLVDHLFRHQYGRMVSILTRVFGLNHLEIIEDAVQDTFLKAVVRWRTELPENPEAWLTQAAKNRAIDLLRKLKSDDQRLLQFYNGPSTIAIEELFLEHEMEDSQLRMIFTACHPALQPKDQIAFALKTIAGFSNKEISVALLLKEETVKKRLTRARKVIREKGVLFAIPNKSQMTSRLDKVLEVLYLIFNEGFHSNRADILIRRELCGEALRLITMIVKKEQMRTGASYALFALFCFHSARLETRLSEEGTIIDLRHQDRSKWHRPLIDLANNALHQSLTYCDYTSYHAEAVIAAEHSNATSFEETNWEKIAESYAALHQHHPTDYSALNLAIVSLQLDRAEEAKALLSQINAERLEKRAYLYYGTKAEYYNHQGDSKRAIECLDIALQKVTNKLERAYLEGKKAVWTKPSGWEQ